MTEEAAAVKQPATSRKKGTPLPPEKIKAKMAEMQGTPLDQLAKACGFYTEITDNATGDVEVRVTANDQNEFLRASLEAQSGVKLAPPSRPYRRSNRSPIIKIGKTGNIVVGGRHTGIAGFPFGEDVDSYVTVQAEPGKIVIVAAEKGAEPQEDGGIDDDDLDADETLEGDDDLDL